MITNYANNDYWYDDTSDGSVYATVTITPNDGQPTRLTNIGNAYGRKKSEHYSY